MNEKKSAITKLEIIPLRKAFPNEAGDLTPWLADNIEALGDRLDLRLSIEQREKAVGDFQVDLLCQDDGGRKVIVENQLEETDHDHLGKLLTYLVNLGAKTAIWVTSNPRPEHQKVVEWLNESMPSDMSFYLVKVEAVRTGESTYSPLFSVLTGPDRQMRQVGQEKKEWAQRHYDRMDFWKALLANANIKTTTFTSHKPILSNYMSTAAGVPRAWFSFSVHMQDCYVYLTFKFKDERKSKAVFEDLSEQKRQIEGDFGEKLVWEGEKGWLSISKEFTGRGLKTREAWPTLHNEMIDAMVRLDRSLRARLRQAYEKS